MASEGAVVIFTCHFQAVSIARWRKCGRWHRVLWHGVWDPSFSLKVFHTILLFLAFKDGAGVPMIDQHYLLEIISLLFPTQHSLNGFLIPNTVSIGLVSELVALRHASFKKCISWSQTETILKHKAKIKSCEILIWLSPHSSLKEDVPCLNMSSAVELHQVGHCCYSILPSLKSSWPAGRK